MLRASWCFSRNYSILDTNTRCYHESSMHESLSARFYIPFHPITILFFHSFSVYFVFVELAVRSVVIIPLADHDLSPANSDDDDTREDAHFTAGILQQVMH